jgi:hypothetical protein
MPRIEVRELISRSIEDVWAYLADPRNELEWQSSARERDVSSGDEIEKGTRFRVVEGFLGRKQEFEFEVVEFEHNRAFTARSISGPFASEYGYRLESADEGTSVTYWAEAEAGLGGAFGKLLDPLVARMFQRDARSSLANLKDLHES